MFLSILHRHLVSTSNEALNHSHNLIPHPIVLDGIEALISNTSRMASPQTPYIHFGCGDVGGRKVKFGVLLAMIVLWVGENCISEWRCR